MLLDKQLTFVLKSTSAFTATSETDLTDIIDLGASRHLGRGEKLMGFASGTETAGTTPTLQVRIYGGNAHTGGVPSWADQVLIWDSGAVDSTLNQPFYKAGPIAAQGAYRFYRARGIVVGASGSYANVSCGIVADASQPHAE